MMQRENIELFWGAGGCFFIFNFYYFITYFFFVCVCVHMCPGACFKRLGGNIHESILSFHGGIWESGEHTQVIGLVR